jgi:hypothetical protein
MNVLLLLPLLGLGGCLAHLWYQGQRFSRLEQNARKVITAPELQSWALKLISEYPSYPSVRMIRTNYPPQLRGLVPGLQPDVNINEANSLNSPTDWTNIPTTVSLIWGTGPLGHKGFLIGPTNFIMAGASEWSSGVYFIKR